MVDIEHVFSTVTSYGMEEVFLHALSVAPGHVAFGRGDVEGQSTLEPGLLAKNQLPSQVPSSIKIPGIDRLNPNECERLVCPVSRQLYLYINASRTVQVGGAASPPILDPSSQRHLPETHLPLDHPGAEDSISDEWRTASRESHCTWAPRVAFIFCPVALEDVLSAPACVLWP